MFLTQGIETWARRLLLVAEEGRMFARFLYPDEAQLVERRDGRE